MGIIVTQAGKMNETREKENINIYYKSMRNSIGQKAKNDWTKRNKTKTRFKELVRFGVCVCECACLCVQ